jgi:nucleotidyltransferase substrate binding protein (TIGR01987 family)
MTKDIRWHQRLNNFNKAFSQLEKAVGLDEYSDLEREGLIQRFEYTYELAWNTIKDFLENQGYTDITGSKDAIRLAFKVGLIKEGDEWMKMVKSRALTSHTYDEETAEAIAEDIKEKYYHMFKALIKRFEEERSGKQGNLLKD